MSRVFFILMIFLIPSCSHTSNQTWENVKTAGRQVQKGMNSIFGKNSESRMLVSDDEFYGPNDEDFIPLNNTDLNKNFTDQSIPQPKGKPGQFGIPNLENFYAPPIDLRSMFRKIHFHTNQHVIREKQEISALIKLANYLKGHQNLYLVIEGHCDERASASYNMALGMRRANAVRSFLVKQGANLNQIYTISRGKEQPIALGHTPEDWKVNRRSEFRIYQK